MNKIQRIIIGCVDIIFYTLIALLIISTIRHFAFQTFQVDGLSMEPQLHNGDEMIMLKKSKIDRFDIVVFPDPSGSQESYVKRVIGLPGDELYVKDDQLFINNQVIEEPYLEPNKSNYPDEYTSDFSLWNTVGELRVPEGFYFVLGDNRPHSGDSRQFGLVPIDSVEGEAVFTYSPFEHFGRVNQYKLIQ